MDKAFFFLAIEGVGVFVFAINGIGISLFFHYHLTTEEKKVGRGDLDGCSLASQ